MDKKAKELLNIMVGNSFQNLPPYEGLVGNLSDYYSRRRTVSKECVKKSL